MDSSMIAWRKASRSTDTGGNCVEVGRVGPCVGVRDSKDPEGGHLALSREAFRVLVAALKR
ncbi:DUF397 domain-containing protein [Spirillospora albida]|uniref:DUF397 domain-containing protein n=1 Tax=Spirillospora albida TaxID=58123 RepID=UPI0005625EF3|nr:DUF397 domain-containing protein [Spirillospora albida]